MAHGRRQDDRVHRARRVLLGVHAVRYHGEALNYSVSSRRHGRQLKFAKDASADAVRVRSTQQFHRLQVTTFAIPTT